MPAIVEVRVRWPCCSSSEFFFAFPSWVLGYAGWVLSLHQICLPKACESPKTLTGSMGTQLAGCSSSGFKMSYSYPNELWSYASLRFPVSSATLARIFGTHFVCAPARVACSRTLHFCQSGTINAYSNPFKSKPAGSSHVCRGSGQGSTEQSLPEEDSDNGRIPLNQYQMTVSPLVMRLVKRPFKQIGALFVRVW